MSASDSGRGPSDPGVPASRLSLLIAAGICLAIPIVALMWVPLYAREDPKLGAIPFFFWYQFLWVILCSIFTFTAYRLVLASRKPRR